MCHHRDLVIAAYFVSAFIFLVQGDAHGQNQEETPSVSPLFEPSIEANHALAPLDKNGDVDYVAAVNEEFSREITPEDNALVKFIEALGPKPLGKSVPEEFFARLRIEPPIENEGQYVSFEAWCKANGIAEPNEANNVKRYGRSLLKLQEWYAMDNFWNSTDCPEVARWVKKNEPSWKMIQQGLKRDNFYYPLVSSIPDRPQILNWNQSYMDALHDVLRHFSIRFGNHVNSGNVDLAIEETLRLYRFAELVSSSSSNLSTSLFACRILRYPNNMALLVAVNEKATEAQLRNLLKEIEPIRFSTNMKRIVDKGERFSGLEAVQMAGRDGIMPTKARLKEIVSRSEAVRKSDPEQAMIAVNSKFDELVRVFDATSTAQTLKNLDQFSEDMTAYKETTRNKSSLGLLLGGKKAQGRQAGQILAGLLIPKAGIVFEAEVHYKSCLRMTKIRLALEIFKKEHGNYPGSLAELSPSILKSIPNAPSLEKPFVYRIEDGKVRLYSLGADDIDQDGQGRLTDARYGEADDIELAPTQILTWAEYLNIQEKENTRRGRR